MATNGDPSQLENQLDRLSIASEDSLNRSNLEGDVTKEDEEAIDTWGFRLKDLYRLALRFYKEKEGKAVHLSYEDKLKLVALTSQVSHGKCNQDSLRPVGVLDVIGRDRRLAWQSLGNLSREEAMQGFINLLDRLCPLFKPFVEAHKRDIEERERLAREEEERQREEAEKLRLEEETKKREEEERTKQEAQRRQVQEALNQQTYHQFKLYAEQQYPGNPEQQGVLIRQLQEQHYHQYMQQLYQQQARQQLSPNNNSNGPLGLLNGNMLDGAGEDTRLLSNGASGDGGNEDSEEENSQGDFSATTTASMWTRKDIKEFKESIRKEGGDAIIKVGHGETVTVRVPTHEDGTCLFWEFATDSYDIGFGVYFEWTKSTTNQVSVHISESEDEEEEDDDDDEACEHYHHPSSFRRHRRRPYSDHFSYPVTPASPLAPLSGLSSLVLGHPLLFLPSLSTMLTKPPSSSSSDRQHRSNAQSSPTPASTSSLSGRSHPTELGGDDIERAGGISALKAAAEANRPPLSVIVPVYRRDCQEEVYAGSHVYPGQGVYLLKFDNSYSLWRSKTLYYRVYYTR